MQNMQLLAKSNTVEKEMTSNILQNVLENVLDG